jgi:hypothetical protein
MRNTMKNYLLGMALVAGLFGSGVVAANAAPREGRGGFEHGPARGFDGRHDGGYDRPEVRRDFGRRDNFVRRDYARPIGGVAYGGGYGVAYGGGYADTYIPPCPGDGYFWTAGYDNGGYWVPGAWTFRGRVGVDRGYAYGGYAYGRGYHDNRFVAERGGNRFGGGFHGRR